MEQTVLKSFLDKDRKDYVAYQKEITDAMEGNTGMITGVTENNKESIFYMFCFCLSVAQSKMIKADEAIQKLRELNFYQTDLNQKEVANILWKRVRFHNVKATNIGLMKTKFESIFTTLKHYWQRYSEDDKRIQSLGCCRQWLISNVKGFSMKASSHLMRNVGFRGLSILDVHVLKSLCERGIINDHGTPKNINVYQDIEHKYVRYAKLLQITVEDLDFLFQKQRTGVVFK